jgi:hypothetical protein
MKARGLEVACQADQTWSFLLNSGWKANAFGIICLVILDNSLHPHMIRFLLQLIHDPASSKVE